MAQRRRSPISPFSLSFLDIMFCGFGAVALLVLILNSHLVSSRKARYKDLSAEVERLEQEVAADENVLASLEEKLAREKETASEIEERSMAVLNQISSLREKTGLYRNETLALKKSIEELQADLKRTDREHRRALASMPRDVSKGRHALQFVGQGHRQYLTGLRLGGRRLLILVDTSASMLDSTIVNIIRRRNMGDRAADGSRKWIQVRKTLRWLLANLPVSTSVKVAAFSTRARFIGASARSWVKMTDRAALKEIAARFDSMVPSGGTSLWRAFSEAASLEPLPDNIILLTDGLPTIGASRPDNKSKVSPDERIRLFERAEALLPRSVPVNTILYPLEGDPYAGGMYWRLAVHTNGSLLTPSRDWP